MHADITAWCRQCRLCAAHHAGKAVKPPLTPIPVAGPFDHVGVDFIKFLKSKESICHSVCRLFNKVARSICYKGSTIAKLLVEIILAWHGVPGELLSKSIFLYGRDAINPTILCETVNLDGYRTEMSQRMAKVWDCTRSHSKMTQRRQKQQRDWHAKDPYFKRVVVYMPAAGQGEAYKLAKKFQGPFRILAMYVW